MLINDKEKAEGGMIVGAALEVEEKGNLECGKGDGNTVI